MRRVGASPSTWEEARMTVEEWAKEYPDAEVVVLVADVGDGVLVTVTGEPKVTEVVGILTMAAQAVSE